MDWQLIAIVAGCLAIGYLIGLRRSGGAEAAPPPRPVRAPTAPTGAGGPYKVQIEDAGPNKIAVIKELRLFTQLGLKETKDLVDAAPGFVAVGLSRGDAEILAQTLTDAGATVAIR
ncbi:MAG: ribosomal protein L7/L12 [Micropepsaceae bacterium]